MKTTSKNEDDLKIEDNLKNSEGRDSRSRLGLETEGTETLGLVSVSYKILELISYRSRLG